MNNWTIYTIVFCVMLAVGALIYFALQREMKAPLYIGFAIVAGFILWRIGSSFATLSTTSIIVVVSTLVLLALLGWGIKTGFLKSVSKTLTKQQKYLQGNEKRQALHQSTWIKYAVALLESLSIVLTLVWAWAAPENEIVRWVFCGGFIGMLILRRMMLPAAVNSAKNGNAIIIILTVCVSIVITGSLLGTSLFELVNESGDGAQIWLESSKPAQALDSEIALIRERIAGLATFADATKAHTEIKENQQAIQANQNKVQRINEQLAALTMPDFPPRFSKYMQDDCSPKQDGNGLSYRTKAKQLCFEWKRITADYHQQKRILESQLPNGVNAGTGTSYADKNSEYNGLQNHLVELEKKRAALSETGQGVVSQWKSEDRMLAQFMSISPETASWLKWLAWAVIFDAIAITGLIVAQMLENIAGGDTRKNNKKKLAALQVLGFDVDQIVASMISNQPLPAPAAIPPAQTVPALKEGGHIITDGLIHGHSGEAVLNEGATNELGRNEIDRLNAKYRGKTTQGIIQPTPKTPRYKGGVFSCAVCGSDYTAKHKNHYRCTECSTNAKTNYAKKHI